MARLSRRRRQAAVKRNVVKVDGSPYAEAGVSGLKHNAGFIGEEFRRDLQGVNGARTYREMVDNNAKIGSALFFIEQVIRQMEFRFDPFSDDATHIEQADFIQTCFNDMASSWPDVLSEILTMLSFGYAPMEVVYKIRKGPSDDPNTSSRFADGQIGWSKIALRSQDTVAGWDLGPHGEILGFTQEAPPNYETRAIPWEKFLLFRPRSNRNNPEGRSVLRSAYFDYYFSKRMTEMAAIGAERNVAGMPVIYVPGRALSASATTAEKAMVAEMRKIGERIRNDEQASIVMPNVLDQKTGVRLVSLELLSAAGGSKATDILSLIQHHERNMLYVLMADFMTIGHESTGALSLRKEAKGGFLIGVAGWIESIEDVFNRFGIPRLAELNGWNLEELPTMRHAETAEVDLEGQAEFLKALEAAGVDIFPDEQLTRHLYGLAKWPTEGRKQAEEMDELDTREKLREEQDAQAIRDAEDRDAAASEREANLAALAAKPPKE